MDDRGWPWPGVVVRAQARLLRVPPHRDRPHERSLHTRLKELRRWMVHEHTWWLEDERQRRTRPWRRSVPRDARWFIHVAKERGFSDAAIRVLFALDPITAEPVRPEGRIEAPEPFDEDDWEALDGEDGMPGADFNEGDGWDPIGPAERIDEDATLEERVDRLVQRIVEQIAYDVTIASDEREA